MFSRFPLNHDSDSSSFCSHWYDFKKWYISRDGMCCVFIKCCYHTLFYIRNYIGVLRKCWCKFISLLLFNKNSSTNVYFSYLHMLYLILVALQFFFNSLIIWFSFLVYVFVCFTRNVGMVWRNFLQNISTTGGTLVTEWGVFLYEYKNWCTEFSQSVFPINAALIIFESGCINLSIFQFVLGHLGVIVW